jgi:predicted TPR repeat methyltransferase
LNPRLPYIHKDCGIAYLQCGHLEEAAKFLQAARLKDPADPQVSYFLCIAEGKLPDESLQREYVRDEFDQFANVFDHTLTQSLEYNTPHNLLEFIGENLGSDFRFRSAVDLGCGTGLFGIEIKNHVDHLEGIDISAGMLEIARSRECYDLLHEGDIAETLGRTDSAFDLFSALDVIVYYGSLDELFRSITLKTNPDALFAFSTESCDGKGFVLQKSGRYAHSIEYIKAVAEKYGCSILATKQSPIRKEHGSWIMGDLYIIRLQPQSTGCCEAAPAVTTQD